MSPKIVDKEAKKQEIIHAGLVVVAKKGIMNVKMEAIAMAAGIGKGTMYEYFSSKEDFFREITLAFLKRIEEAIAVRIFKAKTPVEKLSAFFEAWITVCESIDMDEMLLMLDIWAAGMREGNEEFTKIYDLEKIYTDYIYMIMGIIDDGINDGIFRKVDSFAAAGNCLAIGDALIIQWMVFKEKFDIVKSTRTFVDIFLTGLKNNGGAS